MARKNKPLKKKPAKKSAKKPAKGKQAKKRARKAPADYGVTEAVPGIDIGPPNSKETW